MRKKSSKYLSKNNKKKSKYDKTKGWRRKRKPESRLFQSLTHYRSLYPPQKNKGCLHVADVFL